MSDQSFDFLVFIGRFQPFHLGHLAVIQAGMAQAKQMIILCGSAHQPPSVRNPWTITEREAMIRSSFNKLDNERLHIVPLMDNVYNDESWVRNVQATVNGLVTAHHSVPHKQPSIGLIGHSKDQSSYYLNLFPQWRAVQVENFNSISATPIRERIFSDSGEDYIAANTAQELPKPVKEQLKAFCATDTYRELKEEQHFVNKYKSAWANAPYQPTFVTVDAVVVQSGHVLLVKRKARPGKGLFALPGGFVGANEKLVDACLRELKEETRLKVPAPVLKGSIKRQQVFDDPHRSERGRTITHSYYIELEPSQQLPKVKGGDDAKHALWVPLADINPGNLFEDHYFIIREMIGM